jgi:hypothetical protein
MTPDQANPDEEDEDKAKDAFGAARSEKTSGICGQSNQPVFAEPCSRIPPDALGSSEHRYTPTSTGAKASSAVGRTSEA